MYQYNEVFFHEEYKKNMQFVLKTNNMLKVKKMNF